MVEEIKKDIPTQTETDKTEVKETPKNIEEATEKTTEETPFDSNKFLEKIRTEISDEESAKKEAEEKAKVEDNSKLKGMFKETLKSFDSELAKRDEVIKNLTQAVDELKNGKSKLPSKSNDNPYTKEESTKVDNKEYWRNKVLG